MDQTTDGTGATTAPQTTPPQMTWTRVVDERGRAHLEMRWTVPVAVAAAAKPIPAVSHAA